MSQILNVMFKMTGVKIEALRKQLRVTQEQADEAPDVSLGSILTEVRAKGKGKSRPAAATLHREEKIKNTGEIVVVCALSQGRRKSQEGRRTPRACQECAVENTEGSREVKGTQQ